MELSKMKSMCDALLSEDKDLSSTFNKLPMNFSIDEWYKIQHEYGSYLSVESLPTTIETHD